MSLEAVFPPAEELKRRLRAKDLAYHEEEGDPVADGFYDKLVDQLGGQTNNSVAVVMLWNKAADKLDRDSRSGALGALMGREFDDFADAVSPTPDFAEEIKKLFEEESFKREEES